MTTLEQKHDDLIYAIEKAEDKAKRLWEERDLWLSKYGKDSEDVKVDGAGQEYIYGEEDEGEFDGYVKVYLPESIAFIH